MLAMHYDIALPDDFDMDVIRRRIADKARLMDGFPGLGFKAFIYAERGDAGCPSADNRYAPFYLWRTAEGCKEFLMGAGFAALCRDFGRPVVRNWTVWGAQARDAVASARYATREVVVLAPEVALAEVCQGEEEWVAVERDALVVVSGYEPTTWTVVRFRLWAELPPMAPGIQAFRVGYVARGPANQHD